MNLLDLYSMIQKNEVTPLEAAKALGFTQRDLKFRMTRYGARLPGVLSVLDKIRNDEITRKEAAVQLNVGVREVNQLMNSWRVRRPLKQYLITRASSSVKWEIRKKFAIDFIAGAGTIEDAAEGANVSTRQMRRWVTELLDKHFKMVFKDLKPLSLARRKRLADEIETAEGLELAKQQILKAIADGKRSIADEAVERVVARRIKRESHVRR